MQEVNWRQLWLSAIVALTVAAVSSFVGGYLGAWKKQGELEIRVGTIETTCTKLDNEKLDRTEFERTKQARDQQISDLRTDLKEIKEQQAEIIRLLLGGRR